MSKRFLVLFSIQAAIIFYSPVCRILCLPEHPVRNTHRNMVTSWAQHICPMPHKHICIRPHLVCLLANVLKSSSPPRLGCCLWGTWNCVDYEIILQLSATRQHRLSTGTPDGFRRADGKNTVQSLWSINYTKKVNQELFLMRHFSSAAFSTIFYYKKKTKCHCISLFFLKQKTGDVWILIDQKMLINCLYQHLSHLFKTNHNVHTLY